MIPLLVLLLCAPPGKGDAKKAAAQLIDEGNELLDQRQYQAALARYEAAHELYPTPKIFFNMAEAHRELFNLVEAIEYYERFLAESGVKPNSALRSQSAKAIADLEKRIARLTIDGGALGAEVFVDGQPVGRVPLDRLRVLPGIHQVVIQKDLASKRVEVELKRGEEARIDATLEALPPPALPPAIAEPPIAAVAPVPPEEEGSVVTTWWFWTLIGGAVAIGVGAAVIATTTRGDDFMLGGDLGVSSTNDWRKL